MNAKQAKRLRRIAQEASVGLPGNDLMHDPLRPRGVAVNSPYSTGGVYKALKAGKAGLDRLAKRRHVLGPELAKRAAKARGA